MFSTKHNVKSTLLCGPAELSKSFMFEAAIYWAEEARRVVYITPTRLEKLPAACHDRSNPAPAAFKLMRFIFIAQAPYCYVIEWNNNVGTVLNRRTLFNTPEVIDQGTLVTLHVTRDRYLENYETLMKRLIELHTFATLPSVLLIDDFDAYINDYKENEVTRDFHIARTCSAILDTMNSCSRILKNSVYICVWCSSAMNNINTYLIYFANIWNVTDEEESNTILLQKYSHHGPTENNPSYRYCKLEDGTRVLKQVLYDEIVED